jgi:D,D-heptose 1,7-bisphosphate phosphatase
VLSQALILVGGLGTRLAERTQHTPKPLLEVGGRPFLDHLLDELTRYGVFDDIVLLAGHLGASIAERYAGRRWRSARIRVLVEPAPLGTGGALLGARGVLESAFLLLNGDSFLDCNLLDLATPPLFPQTLVRMALKRQQGGERYGRAEIAGDRLVRFLPPGTAGEGPINAGVYLMSRRVLDFIPPAPCALEGALVRMAEQGLIETRCYDGYFVDIGVPAQFAEAQRALPLVLRRPAVFFDRDGVLNEDRGYVHRSEDVMWVAGARAAVKLANDGGYLVFVVSNQAGVARGYYGIDAVERLHAWMGGQLAEVGAHVDAFQYCPFHETATVAEFRRHSDRRKPAPGMLLDCMREWGVDTASSFLIGDQPSDVAAAAAAGIPGYLFAGGDIALFTSRHIVARR